MSELIQRTWEILFYTWEDGDIKINVIFQDETIWLSQKQIAEIFGVWIPAISKHLKNIFEEWELDESVVVSILEIPTKHWAIKWKTQNIKTKFYNLDAILSVWYRVNSKKATKFRIWANKILKEFLIKWFVLDDERLKNWQNFGKDYFEELLARIREIRASERRFYQKITDIYATSVDYDPKYELTQTFFAEIQNKFLYAITWETAPEIIYHRVDVNKPNMWLTTWKGQKTWWKIVSTDIKISKNYLKEDEIEKLNLIVSQYLDFAELQAKKWKLMTMQNWIDKTKSFLELNDMEILEWKGKISKKQADEKAIKEFEQFRIEQDKNYISDFDKFIKEISKKKLK